MKRFILALVLAVLGSYSYATDVEVGRNDNVIAIDELQVGGVTYRVEFWYGDFLAFYQPHPELFPFIDDEEGAEDANLAIREVLNSTLYGRVGWVTVTNSATNLYAVVHNEPFLEVEPTVWARASIFQNGVWSADVLGFNYLNNTIYAVFKSTSAGDVNKDGAVNISDLLKLEQILIEP